MDLANEWMRDEPAAALKVLRRDILCLLSRRADERRPPPPQDVRILVAPAAVRRGAQVRTQPSADRILPWIFLPVRAVLTLSICHGGPWRYVLLQPTATWHFVLHQCKA